VNINIAQHEIKDLPVVEAEQVENAAGEAIKTR
jgi:hypothetical protein